MTAARIGPPNIMRFSRLVPSRELGGVSAAGRSRGGGAMRDAAEDQQEAGPRAVTVPACRHMHAGTVTAPRGRVRRAA